MDLSVIVLNLNTRDMLEDCLRSLVQSEMLGSNSEYSMEVVVSDNGSTDGGQEMVKSEFAWAKLVENGRNLGFAAGNNAALSQAMGRYVLFLNSDTKVPAGTLSTMLKFMDGNPKAGVSTCYVEMRDGMLEANCHRGFPTPLNSLSYFTGLYKIFPRSKIFGGYYQTYKDLTKVCEVDSVAGAFMMVRREAAQSAALGPNKWWDEDFFFFGEDLDFCYRLKQKGWQILFNPAVKIWHYKGATHGLNKQGLVTLSEEERRKIIESTTEAMKLFYEKHYLHKYPSIVTRLVLSGVAVLARIRNFKGGI